MKHVVRRTAVVTAAAMGLLLPLAAPAGADGHLTLVAGGFVSPLHIEVAGRTLHVADADAGAVFSIDLKNGRRTTLLEAPGAVFPAGVSAPGGPVLAVGSAGEDAGLAQLVGGHLRPIADTLAAEIFYNPDGQPQFDENEEPYDALSNPYDVLALPGVTYIADAGANAIWEVRANGAIRPLLDFPELRGDITEACDDVSNNGEEDGGCDAVPTGIALGPDGYLYVSGLGSFEEGSIYKIDRRTGEIAAQWSDLPPLTDLTVAPDGTVYAASPFVGLVIAIAPGGDVSVSAVPGAVSVSFAGGVLYVSTAEEFGAADTAVWTLALASFAPLGG